LPFFVFPYVSYILRAGILRKVHLSCLSHEAIKSNRIPL
jgi:hypothetical protein